MAAEDFRHIVESLRVAVAIADASGIVTYANAAFMQLAGKPDPGVTGRSLASLFHREDGRRIQQGIVRVAQGNTASAIIEARVAAGGAWVQLALQPALDAREKPEGIIAVLLDIAGQRESEGALDVTTARLMALVEDSPNATLIENSTGEVELVNAAFGRLLGLESAPQSLVGLGAVEVIGRSPAVDAKALARAHKKPTRSRPAFRSTATTATRRAWNASRSWSTTSRRARSGFRGPSRPAGRQRERARRLRDRAHREDRRGAFRGARGNLRDFHPRAAARIRSRAGGPLPAHPLLHGDGTSRDRRPRGLFQGRGPHRARTRRVPPARHRWRISSSGSSIRPRKSAASCA